MTWWFTIPDLHPDPEIEANRRDIEGMKPLLEEAVKRTNAAFIEVETKTFEAQIECALIRDLTEGWKQ